MEVNPFLTKPLFLAHSNGARTRTTQHGDDALIQICLSQLPPPIVSRCVAASQAIKPVPASQISGAGPD